MTWPGGPPPDGAQSTRFVDLHMHSTASDGAVPPAAVAAAASEAGLSVIALTDHDTLSGVLDARGAGAALGVRVVAGVELSVIDGQSEIHVLGLHIARPDELEHELAVFRAARRTRAERIVEQLNALGVPLTMDAVLEVARGGAIGRPHVARAIVAGGWARDPRDAFDRYLGWGKPAYVPKHKLGLADAVQLIHDTGGLAVLAHPGAEGNRRRLEAMAALGLDGVEVLHPSHSAEDIRRLGALVDHLKLVPSGGSDWHGGAEGPRTIGGMRVPFEFLERQEERVAMRQAGERVA